MNFLLKLRLRVVAVLIALGLGAAALIGWAAWPVVPVVGVALMTAVALVNTITHKLSPACCQGCGKSLAGLPAGAYGAVCPGCGAVNTQVPAAERRAAGADASGEKAAGHASKA
jgi:hypothetical protein